MSSETRSTGIGFFGLFFIVLFIFKVAKIGIVANWSWWAITAPLWGPFAIVIVVLIFAVIVAAISDR